MHRPGKINKNTNSVKIKNSFKLIGMVLLAGFLCCTATQHACAQTSATNTTVPDWALPGSATHKQVPPPLDFHRAARTTINRIGIFDGQSDVGAALAPGSSSYDAATGQYTINSAGYNVWYTRDEFRFLWEKMSGDVSLAADVNFPDSTGYADRKAVLIIRQNLDDDAKEAMAGLHGGGLLHFAWRSEKNTNIREMRVNVDSLAGKTADDRRIIHAKRIGIEKHGDEFTIYVSISGEPMHQYGAPVHLHLNAPFYVGIGFSSHQPTTVYSAVLSEVLLENSAGKVR